uniref:Uncharacterized protein n=1 Tax=Arundo donax TaxID=35708 RepID=A0A0A8Z1I6_ARUDO
MDLATAAQYRSSFLFSATA